MAYVSSFSKVFRHDIIHFQLSRQHFFQVLSNQLATFHHFNPYYYSKIQLKNRTIFSNIYSNSLQNGTNFRTTIIKSIMNLD